MSPFKVVSTLFNMHHNHAKKGIFTHAKTKTQRNKGFTSSEESSER